MAFSSISTTTTAMLGSSQGYNPNKDVELVSPPSDGVTCIAWSPTANFIVATSWDKNVRCWEVQANGQSQAKAMVAHAQPVLCADWNADGTTVYAGDCERSVKAWNLQTNQQQKVAEHAGPVRHVKFIKEMNMLVTGSWDKTLKYWDLRSPNPVHTHNLPERCYALDCVHPLLVVGTADRHIQIFNLANPQVPFKQLQSQLKFQTRSITCFPDKQGYLVGSIEGRVAVQHVDDAAQSKNFTFKCHRVENDVYAVNDIKFHPVHHTFVTAGDDGAYNFWDKENKQRLKAMQRSDQPIPCAAFNADGSIYAYAVSYNWYKGYQHAQQQHHILLHATQEAEVKSKGRVKR